MLRHRTISGLATGLAFLGAVAWLPAPGCWIVLVAIAALAQWEFYTMIRRSGVPVFRIIGVLCGAALISATFFSKNVSGFDTAFDLEHAILFLAVVAIFVRQFPQKHNHTPIATIACTLLGIFYVPYLLNFFTRLLFAWDAGAGTWQVDRTGRLLVVYLVVVVKFTDIGAYFTGRFLGRHKLFPRLSPAKTWEGFFGGMAAALAASLVFYAVTGGRLGVVSLHIVDAVILGLGLPLAAVVGDLFESLLKRACEQKDSGNTLPGMGGILDVLDSLLFGAPTLYIYLRFFL